MLDIRIPTPDTNLAAALSTLQFPVGFRDVLDDKSGDNDFTWRIFPVSTARPKVDLREWLKWLRDGTLEKKDPEHPLLDGIGACRNRERILSLIKAGKSIALAEAIAGKRTLYVHHPSVSPPASFGKFVTRDFRLVCALGRLGFPIVSWKGQPGSYEFTLTERPVIALGGPPTTASALAAQLAAGQLSLDHPIQICIATLKNQSKLLNIVEKHRRHILLRHPKSGRAAWVQEDADDKAYDRVQRHFKI